MTKYRYIGTETRWVALGAAIKVVDPGDVVDIPDGQYAQTGATGEEALFEALKSTTVKKAGK